MRSSDVNEFMVMTGVDAVGGITQSALNAYSTQYYKLFPAVFKGDGQDADLDLKYSFQITGGLEFSLGKVTNGADLLKRSILADPMFQMHRSLFRTSFDEPVFTVSLPKTVVSFWALSSGEHLADVELTADVTVSIVVTTGGQGSYNLFVQKININIQTVTVEDAAALHMATGCDINKLIAHILNAVLTAQLTRFLQTYPLPQPNLAVSGFAMSLASLDVQDSTLLLGMNIRPAALMASNQLQGLHQDQAEGFETALFGKPVPRTASEPRKSRRGDIEADHVLRLDQVQRALPPGMEQLEFKTFAADAVPSGDIFLAFSNTVFQALATKYININQQYEHDSGGWAHYWYKYSYRIWNPVTQLIASGLQISADMEASASGGAGLSGCSSFVSAELGAEIQAEPRVTADATFASANSGHEVWVWPYLFPFVVKADAWIKPDVPGLDFLVSVMASGVLSFFSAAVLPLLSLAMQFKLITLPANVPGTPVPMKPSIGQIGNWESMLFVGLKITY